MALHLRDIPTRVSTGAYILHSGVAKWNGSEEQAKGVHGMASGAFPFLAKVPPDILEAALRTAWMRRAPKALLRSG